jgi:Transposase DDE domain
VNLSIQHELHLLAEELRRHLSPSTLERLARETRFVQRSSKYRAQDLVALYVWMSQNIASTSLTKLCSQLEASTGILMSPEGLNQRFNNDAVRFLQRLFALLMKSEICSSGVISSEYMAYFQRIRILDSTIFQVPDSFAEYYPGSAGIKIQLEYDLLSGKFLNLQVEPRKNNIKPLVRLAYRLFGLATYVYET